MNDLPPPPKSAFEEEKTEDTKKEASTKTTDIARPSKTKSKRGRKSVFAGKKIYKMGKWKTDNPRRIGTRGYYNFKRITEGMGYEEYILDGGLNVDLQWDVHHGYVELK